MARELTRDEKEQEAAYVKDHWDNQAKSVGYLLAGHGAALVACFTILKDNHHNPSLKGFGTFIQLSASGLIFGVIAYGALSLCRTAKIKLARGTSTPAYMPYLVIFAAFLFLSLICFLAELLVIAFKFGDL